MKQFIIALALLTFYSTQKLRAQILNKTEREYLILGTLGDNSQRILGAEEKNILDSYFTTEQPLVHFVDSILKIDYSNSVYSINRYRPKSLSVVAEVVSEELCKKFDRFYKETPNSRDGVARLPDTVCKTDEEKLAFLAGTYIRFGIPCDTAYCINIPLSLSKVRVCYKILKDYKCKATFEILKNAPTIVRVYFHPDRKVEAYLSQYFHMRRKMDYYLNSYLKNMGLERTKTKN